MTRTIRAKTARGAANQAHRAIMAEAKAMGQSPDHIFVREETEYADHRRGKTAYRVVWEEGPFEWAIVASLGGAIWAEEIDGILGYGAEHDPSFDFEYNNDGYHIECANSYSLIFYPEY